MRQELSVCPAQTLDHVPTAVTRCSLNDNGWGVWTTGRQNESQVFVWDGKKVRPLGTSGRNNRDAIINLKNWVVWSANRIDGSGSTDVFLWKGTGEPICLSADCLSAAQPALNDKGDVVWWGDAGGKNRGVADIFYLSVGTKKPVNLTEGDRDGASRNPRINDAGIISYERSSKKKNTVVTNLVYVEAARPNKRVQLTDSDDLNVTNGAINAAGELVWEQYDDLKKQWQIWKYLARKGFVQRLSGDIQGNHHAPDINTAGTVVWHADGKGRSDLFWHNGGSAASALPVPNSGKYTRPIAINSRGQVLYASGEGSGSGFDILLALPDKQSDANIALISCFALCSGVLISLIRGSRVRLYAKLPH